MSSTSPLRLIACCARNACHHRLVGERAGGGGRVGHAGLHRVDPDPVLPELVGRHLHEMVDRRLPRAVRREEATREHRRGGRDRHERTRPGTDHRLPRVFQQEVDRHHVQVDLVPELVVFEQQNRLDRPTAGYHHRDVQLALIVRRRVDRGAHGVAIGGVADGVANRESLLGEPGGRVPQLLLGAAGDRHSGAVARARALPRPMPLPPPITIACFPASA